jgi:hypothetical protein
MYRARWPSCTVPAGLRVQCPLAFMFSARWPSCTVPAGLRVQCPLAFMYSARWSSCTVPAGLHVQCPLAFMYSARWSCQTSVELNSLDRFSKNPHISNFIKIRPVRAELFHADGKTDGHDEANNSFSHF